MPCSMDSSIIEKVIAFHGHSCPGLVIGIRAAELALREFGGKDTTELVAIAETDMCGVDAIQFLTGCTYGKGNFLHRDFGKMAFTFHDRTSGKGFRAVLKPDADGGIGSELRALMKLEAEGTGGDENRAKAEALRSRLQGRYMEAELDELFSIGPPRGAAPRPAKVLQSLRCDACGEMTMESRTRRFDGKTLCIPCFAAVEQKV